MELSEELPIEIRQRHKAKPASLEVAIAEFCHDEVVNALDVRLRLALLID
jgi:hypothetical protein